jgi:signal transduction histidine kinase
MSNRPKADKPARTRSIGTTLVGLLLVPLIGLVGLWGFVASTTISKATDEYQLHRVGLGLYQDTQVLLLAFEKERASTFIWQSSPVTLPASKLAGVRHASDVAIAAFEASSDVSPRLHNATNGELDSIRSIRSSIDDGQLNPAQGFQQYGDVINAVLTVFITPAQPDTTLYEHSLASLDAARSQEQLSRQIVLIEGVELDHTTLNAADRLVFAGAAANEQIELQDAIALADDASRPTLVQLSKGPIYTELTTLQNLIGDPSTSRAAYASALSAWTSVSTRVYNQLQAIGNAFKLPIINASATLGRTLVLQAALSGGLGLLALLLSVFLGIRFGRRVRAELTGLRDGAQTMANERLPRVIKELRDGAEVDVAAESPPLPVGKIAEVARVAEAFSTVQRTAIDAAVGQANLRKGVSQVFLNLSLRNQSLLHRQLGLLDTLERTTEDPNALGELFRLDHLTTRMRRNAESLIILSGSVPGRGWRDPVPVLDVLRAAIAEVEDYVRVEVVGESSEKVVGVAVNDVVHLIAELVENATAFSPPNTQVHLRAETVGFGVAVEVEDRGLGPSPEELEMMNARLAGPSELELPGSGQLGMFVVGQLAARHGIKVSLRQSPYGGTTAIVLMPHAIIVPREEANPPSPGNLPQRQSDQGNRSSREADATDPDPSWAAALAVGTPGRHRLETILPAVHPETRGYAEPASNGGPLPLNDRTITPESNGFVATDLPGTSSEPVRGPWEPPIGQETTVRPKGDDPLRTPAGVHPSWGEPTPSGTHLGLPLRVRQANLAPQLRRQNTEEAAVPPPPDDPVTRSPEETLSMMSAFQDGWRRGRSDALDELDEGPSDEPGDLPEARLEFPDVQHAHDGEASS